MSNLRTSITLSLIAAVSTALVGCTAAEPPAAPGRVTPAASQSAEPSETPTPEATESPAEATPEATEGTDEAAQSAALDKYVAAEAAQIPKLKEQYADSYSEITIEGEHPDLIIFTYTFVNKVDKAKAEAYFKESLPELEKAAETQIFPIMASYGVKPTQRMRYTYLAPDGSEVWSHDFSSK